MKHCFCSCFCWRVAEENLWEWMGGKKSLSQEGEGQRWRSRCGLAAVESGDEGDGVAVLDHVVEAALQLPIAVVDQNENSWTPVHPKIVI